jgi:predicted membrane protein
MSFVSSGLFWGVIIILIGLSIILKEVFHIHFPFLRVLFGVLLIYWGIKVISGNSWKSNKGNTSVFSSGNINYSRLEKEYNIVFGKGNIDLFKADIPSENTKLEMNVVFGSADLILNDSVPAMVQMNSVFGNVRSADRQTGGFGSGVFTTPAYSQDKPHYLIEANAVFGNINIDSKKW